MNKKSNDSSGWPPEEFDDDYKLELEDDESTLFLGDEEDGFWSSFMFWAKFVTVLIVCGVITVVMWSAGIIWRKLTGD